MIGEYVIDVICGLAVTLAVYAIIRQEIRFHQLKRVVIFERRTKR